MEEYHACLYGLGLILDSEIGVLALGRTMRCLLYLAREDTPILLVASVVRLPNGWGKQIHEHGVELDGIEV